MSLPAVYQCPAKVNLTLSVGPPRQFDGMHPICSWMVRVSLYDDLTIIPLASGDSSYDIAFADDAPQPSPIDWPIDKDLAVRAHRLLEQYTKRSLPVRMIVRKRIPVGAGLGGGSSNAATMLIALNDTFRLGLESKTLALLSTQLGSDVAFFLGGPSAIVAGVGQSIRPAPMAASMHLVLILAPLSCNTAAVYRRFDAMRPDAALRRTDAGDEPFNDLADAAIAFEPRLGEVRDQCAEQLGVEPQVTGSGAAMFVVCESEPAARDLARQITDTLSIPAVPVHTL